MEAAPESDVRVCGMVGDSCPERLGSRLGELQEAGSFW